MSVKQIFNTSAELDFPNVLPTLDLDFANSKTLDPRITFTRASGGSYVGDDALIKYAGVNEPRFDHDPVTGESLGLLIEESRQNLLLRSEEFDQSPWIRTGMFAFGSGSSVNAITAPDGTMTADRLTEDISTGLHDIRQTSSYQSGVTYTWSVFFKAASGTRNFQMILSTFAFPDNPFVNVNPTTGEIINSSDINASVQPYQNGWYRASFSATADASANGNIYLRLIDGTSINYTGDGTSGIYIWGAQLEQGSFPTSYIPTQSATRTRNPDNAQITGKNFSDFYRQDEGSFFSSFKINALNLNGFPGVFYVDDGTISNSIGVYVNDAGDDKIGSEAYALGIGQYHLFSNSAVIPNMINKVCNSYKINNFYTSFSDRNSILSDNLGSIPTVNILRIGSLRGNLTKLNGTISRLTYYPRALQPSQLQSLTS